MNLEQDLRRALRKEAPSAGFADRVAARIASGDAKPVAQPPVKRSMSSSGIWLALAASLAIAVSSGWMYEQHRTRVESEHAAEQVQLALRIAGQSLAEVQVRLAEISRR